MYFNMKLLKVRIDKFGDISFLEIGNKFAIFYKKLVILNESSLINTSSHN